MKSDWTADEINKKVGGIHGRRKAIVIAFFFLLNNIQQIVKY